MPSLAAGTPGTLLLRVIHLSGFPAQPGDRGKAGREGRRGVGTRAGALGQWAEPGPAPEIEGLWQDLNEKKRGGGKR